MTWRYRQALRPSRHEKSTKKSFLPKGSGRLPRPATSANPNPHSGGGSAFFAVGMPLLRHTSSPIHRQGWEPLYASRFAGRAGAGDSAASDAHEQSVRGGCPGSAGPPDAATRTGHDRRTAARNTAGRGRSGCTPAPARRSRHGRTRGHCPAPRLASQHAPAARPAAGCAGQRSASRAGIVVRQLAGGFAAGTELSRRARSE